MSGETEANESGWTIDTLRLDLLARLDALDRLHQSQRRDDKDAVEKALAANDRRLDGMNEFRDSLNDMQSTLMPRSESTARWQAVTERVEELKSRVDGSSGEHVGGAEVRRAVLALAGLLVACIGVATSLLLATR